MTSTDMYNEFLILYDKITNFDAPGYTQTEISIFLTKGQERVVLDTYNHLANKYKKGFEGTELRRKDLAELVRSATVTASADQSGVYTNGTYFDLPTDLLYVITEQITLSSDDECLDGKTLAIKPVRHDEYTSNINNPFKKPGNTIAWRLDVNANRHEIVTGDDYDIASYYIRYIKKPVPIIVGANTVDGVVGPSDCELNSIMHKRIVDEAVKIATATTNPEQYQIKTVEQQQSE